MSTAGTPPKPTQARSVGSSGSEPKGSGSSSAEEEWQPATVTAAAGKGRGMRLGAAARRPQQELATAAAEPLLPISAPTGGVRKDEKAGGWDGEDEVSGRSARLVGAAQRVLGAA